MGNSLVILTYHENGMGSPKGLCIGGIAWRIDTYYSLAMGGAATNGKDIGFISVVGVDNLTADPIPMIAYLEIASKVSDNDQNTADITVKISAREAFPEKVKLHIIVTETIIDWKKVYDLTPFNGQTVMYNVVCDLITDSTGAKVPALKAGKTHSVTETFTNNPTFHNPDSLRVTALIQVEDTKKILSVAKTKWSPLDTGIIIPIIVNEHLIKIPKLQIISAGHRHLRMTLPFNNATVVVYNTAGRELKRQSFDRKKGQIVTILLSETKGLLLIKIKSADGYFTVFKVPIRL